MNKGTMIMIKALSILSLGALDFLDPKGIYGSGPKGIPHKSSHRYRPHAPNDGHWHMKFHRSRR